MPIVPPAEPPFRIVRLSHLVLGSSDLERARAFWVDALGLIESSFEGGRLHLRGLEERQHHHLVLVEGEPSARRLGFKVASEDDLDAAAAWFSQRGLPCAFADPDDAPRQGRTLRARDPSGVPLEFAASVEPAPRKLQEYAAYRGAAVKRIDHFNLFAADLQAAHAFWAGLGFRTSEYTETEPGEAGPDPQLWAVWMHRKGNVHDVALTNGRGPRLHHLGLYVDGPLDVIRACDVLSTAGFVDAIERGPGRHGISNAFFLYLRDPDGHRVELFSSDYSTVDPDFEPIRWSLRDPQRQTLWGAPAPRSWFEEGTAFEGVEPLEPRLEARPIVAV